MKPNEHLMNGSKQPMQRLVERYRNVRQMLDFMSIYETPWWVSSDHREVCYWLAHEGLAKFERCV